MARERHWLDSERVIRLRKAKDKKWRTREGFVDYSGVCLDLKTIKYIEKEKRHVTWATVVELGRVLEVDARELIKRTVYLDGLSGTDLPEAGPRHQKQLEHARDCDMAGNHQEAVAICARVFAALGAQEWGSKAAVIVRWASYLDHCGDHEAALTKLDELRDPIWLARIKKDMLLWAAYHRSIALRRLRRFDEAEKELQPLLVEETDKFWPGAHHQLGVIYLERAAGQRGSPLLQQALDYLTVSRLCWQKENNHREGFSLRRMAHIYALQGRYPEASEHYFDAAVVLARSGCQRYLKETRADLVAMLSPKNISSQNPCGEGAGLATVPPADDADIKKPSRSGRIQ